MISLTVALGEAILQVLNVIDLALVDQIEDQVRVA